MHQIATAPMLIGDIAFREIDQFDKSWLDQMRRAQTTLIVPSNSPAEDVLRQMGDGPKNIVLVEDETNPGTTTGIVIPAWVVYRVITELGTPLDMFAQAVQALREAGRSGYFGHEYLNVVRVDPLWCEKGKHFLQKPPCSQHP
jgi:hypothetical protein